MRSRSLVLINGIVSGTSSTTCGPDWLAVVETDVSPCGVAVPPTRDANELVCRMPVRNAAPAATMPINAAAAVQAYIRRRGFAGTVSCGTARALEAGTNAFDAAPGSFIPSTSNSAWACDTTTSSAPSCDNSCAADGDSSAEL